MLGLAFLNPLMLWALPLCAVPVVIHLLNRRRFKRVPWAAMEFLLAAMKRNRKRLYMEQWLVLALRVLAVLLLVGLVGRPQLGGGLFGIRIHHVIVLDDSASMAQRSGSTNLFERAKSRVKELADHVGERRSGDLFSIVRLSRSAEPDLWAQRVGPGFGRRIAAQLAELPVGDGTADLGACLATTLARAQEVADSGRTAFYVMGDRRAFDWATSDDRPRPAVLAALAAMRADREELIVVGAGGPPDNLAVVDIRLVDRLAVAGIPVALAVDVQNLGLDPAAATAVAVEVDGKSRIVLPVPPLAPGERVAVPVSHRFHSAGHRSIEAVLDSGDTFPLDDRRTLVLEVCERSRVLLVDGQPDEEGGETVFLQAAFDVPESGIETQVVSDTALDELDLDSFDLIWWCNVQSPTQSMASRIEAFVAAGGGLIVTGGSQVDASRIGQLWWRDGAGPLPLPFGEVEGDPDRPERAVLVAPTHGVADGVATVLDLLLRNVVRVKRWLRIEEPPGHTAAVVARIHNTDGPPLLVTRPFGLRGGEVALLAVTANRSWSNLPSTDLFLVLACQLHRFAARRHDPSARNLGTADVYRQRLDPGLFAVDAIVRALAGDEERTYTAYEAAPPDGDGGGPEPLLLSVPMRELRHLGSYEIELRRHDGGITRQLIARNPPTDEGRLVGFSEAAFARIYPPELRDRVTFARDGNELAAGAGEGELWPLLAALLLAGLLLESLLAWRFGRR